MTAPQPTEPRRPANPFATGLLRRELGVLSRLSTPVVLSQLGLMAMGVVDTLMVSRLGVTELAATALGNAWQWTFLSLGLGVVTGIDPLISQAHGRGDGPGTALAFQRGVVIALLASVPICVGLTLTRPGLLLLGQEPAVAALAGEYNAYKLPVVPCFLVYSVLRQYLQGRTLMAPATWVIWLANIVHVGLNWALIFGHAGFTARGVQGAAIASSLSTSLLVLGLGLWVRGFRLHEGAWRPWGRAVLEARGLWQAVRLGLPAGLQFSLEATAFSISTLMAGWLGQSALGSHQIVLNLSSLSFMVPIGIAQGAGTRVGNLIGAGDLPGMRRSVVTALAMGATVMGVSALAFTLLRFELPRLYTDEPEVVRLAAAILPFAGAFQLFDGTQGVAGGILRGMGRPDAAAAVNLIGYYVVALPLAYGLAFRHGFGLPGIWLALTTGLIVVACALLLWVLHTARAPLQALQVEP